MTNNQPWYEEKWMELNRDERNLTINQVLEKIVAEAERRGEMKALEEMVWNGMFPKNLPKSMENGYLACGMDLNEKIDAKLTSLKTP